MHTISLTEFRKLSITSHGQVSAIIIPPINPKLAAQKNCVSYKTIVFG